MKSDFFLEILNGGAITPELICLILLARYLFKESRDRGLNGFDWFNLPPSMNLILAMFIFDAGVCIRSVTIWLWRVMGAGNFSGEQVAALVAGGSLIVLGSLCKIRALTRPDFGDGPWLASAGVTSASIMALLYFR